MSDPQSSLPSPSLQNREQEFDTLLKSLDAAPAYESGEVALFHGDSLEMLRKVPDRSVSLILTDPPYHSTKKANITGDTDFEEDEHFLEWMEQYAAEWKRVLKLSGTIYVYCATEMSARLEVMLSRYLRPINHVVWTKPNEPGFDGWKGKMNKRALRKWYPHSERILVLEHGAYGSYEAYRRSPLGEYLRNARKTAGLTTIYLTEVIKAYGNINRGGAVANWEAGRNIPSREQYEKVKAALEETGKVGTLLDYDDLVRPMQVHKDIKFTDVWDFMSVRPFTGKHPAEKPQDMLKHIIEASSYPGDIVLDCFAGSGSTLVAAVSVGRRAIGIELENQWIERATNDLRHFDESRGTEQIVRSRKRGPRTKAAAQPTLELDALFD